jgi:intracellular proteinase inhibitor BsuPI
VVSRCPLVVAVLTSLVFTACTNPSSPAANGPVRLRGDISQSTIARGDTATITFRLENITTTTVVLNFTSGCNILPYINDRQSGQVVYPSGGGWGCTAALTSFELPAGGTKTVDVVVRATDTTSSGSVALKPGRYDAYATLEDTNYGLRSATISFTVQ